MAWRRHLAADGTGGNRDSIYAIYDGEQPEQDDALDSIAAAPEANALLNRVRREHPELTVSEGVRRGFRVAADLTAHPRSHAEAARLAQCQPGVPATARPPDINRRVNAVLTAKANHGQCPLHRAGTRTTAFRVY